MKTGNLDYYVPIYFGQYLKLGMDIAFNVGNALETWVYPLSKYSSGNAAERRIVLSAKSTKEQEEIYADLYYYRCRFLYDGCKFGVEYAYKEYIQTHPSIKNMRVSVYYLGRSHAPTHDLAAYIATKLFWKLTGFEPNEDIYYSPERKRFIFPHADRFPIGMLCLKQTEDRYRINKAKERYPEIYEQAMQMEHQYIDDYFSR